MVAKTSVNISGVAVSRWCAHLQKYCAPFSSLCFIFFYFFLYTVWFAISSFFMSMPGWLKNRKKRKMSFLFQCRILPFDFDMFKRMSYNVESAKSVLFSKVCDPFERRYRFHVKRNHSTKWTQMLYRMSVGRMWWGIPCRWLDGVMWSWDDTSSMASCFFWGFFLHALVSVRHVCFIS